MITQVPSGALLGLPAWKNVSSTQVSSVLLGWWVSAPSQPSEVSVNAAPETVVTKVPTGSSSVRIRNRIPLLGATASSRLVSFCELSASHGG